MNADPESRLTDGLRRLLGPPADVGARAAAAVARARTGLDRGAPAGWRWRRLTIAAAAVLLAAAATFWSMPGNSRLPSRELYDAMLQLAAQASMACTTVGPPRLDACSALPHALDLPADARSEGPKPAPGWPGAHLLLVRWQQREAVLLLVRKGDDRNGRSGVDGDLRVFRRDLGDTIAYEITAASATAPLLLPALR
jgi:hypothetical protein